MEYKRFDNSVIVRLDKGEEITGELLHIAEREGIRLASVDGLGAVDDFTVGVFHLGERRYHANTFRGYHEITSLTGTISTMSDTPYLHLHMSAANLDGVVVGGHLNRAMVSAVCEIVIHIINGQIDRKPDGEMGLNMISFQ